MRLFTFLALPLALMTLAATPALAKTHAPFVSKATQARERAILSRYDAAIAQALAADPALKAAIDKDLKDLAGKTDPKQRQAGIAAFQARHGKAYRKVLILAKVDWNAIIAELARLYPGMKFRVVDGLYAVGYKDDDGTPAPPAPVRTTTEIRPGDFEMEITPSCGAISGAGVTFAGGTLDASVWAAEAGMCSNTGILNHPFTVPAGATTQVTMAAEMRNEVFAVGVLGGASASATTFYGVDAVKTKIEYCSVFVAAAWAASDECNNLDTRVSVTLQPGAYDLTAMSWVSAGGVGVIAATNARSRIKLVRTTLTQTQ